MKMVILTKNQNSYTSLRIEEEAKKKGTDVLRINPMETACTWGGEIIFRGDTFNNIDMAFLRTPPFKEEKEYFHHVGRILEMQGVRVINSPSAVEISGDKFRTSLVLQRAGVPVLPSILVRKREDLAPAVERVGGLPVFLKTLGGTRGIGTIFCPCMETLIAGAETLWAYYSNIMVERFAKDSPGETIRVLVRKAEIIGAIRNKAEEGFLRSNFSRGGKSSVINLEEEIKSISVKGVSALGLSLAGVDLVRDGGQWKVLEINSAPGIKSIESATGENIAEKILSSH